jgi:hypothetical protein
MYKEGGITNGIKECFNAIHGSLMSPSSLNHSKESKRSQSKIRNKAGGGDGDTKSSINDNRESNNVKNNNFIVSAISDTDITTEVSTETSPSKDTDDINVVTGSNSNIKTNTSIKNKGNQEQAKSRTIKKRFFSFKSCLPSKKDRTNSFQTFHNDSNHNNNNIHVDVNNIKNNVTNNIVDDTHNSKHKYLTKGSIIDSFKIDDSVVTGSASTCTNTSQMEDQNIEIQIKEQGTESKDIMINIESANQSTITNTLTSGAECKKGQSFIKKNTAEIMGPKSHKTTMEKRRYEFGQKCSVKRNSALNASTSANAKNDEPVTSGWYPLNGNNFSVRKGPHYSKTKEKAPSAASLYESIHCICFRSQRRVSLNDTLPIRNINVFPNGRIPRLDDERVPHLLIIQYQIPSVQPSMMKSTDDGLGGQTSFYFVPSEKFCNESNALYNNEKNADVNVSGAVKLFTEWCARCEDSKEWRSRFKSIARVRQEGESGNFLKRFNGKPMLVKESSSVKRGVTEDGIRYLEYNVNMHKWAYVAKKGIVSLIPQAMEMKIDLGFTIEARENAEMPENILASITLEKVNPTEVIQLPTDLHIDCKHK